MNMLPSLEEQIAGSLVLLHKFEPRLNALLQRAQEETASIDLFAPPPPTNDCPICCIPLPRDETETAFFSCCGSNICAGCDEKKTLTNLIASLKKKRMKKKGMKKKGKEDEMTCAFCRQPTDHSIEALQKIIQQQREPEALRQLATRYLTGDGVERSEEKAFELHIQAAEMGHGHSFGYLGLIYKGTCQRAFEPQFRAFLEIAAKKGSLSHREFLAKFGEAKYGRMNIAIKHWKVAASAGSQKSLDELMKVYREGGLEKEELSRILREFQVSNEAVKSKDRDDFLRRRKEDEGI